MKIASTHDLQGVKGEAPAIFKHEGTYYCLTSQLTGYAPNANKYSTHIWLPITVDSATKTIQVPWCDTWDFVRVPAEVR